MIERRTPPKLTVQPLKGGGWRVFLDDYEITHCVGVEVDFVPDEGLGYPYATIRIITIVDSIDMARISAINADKEQPEQ